MNNAVSKPNQRIRITKMLLQDSLIELMRQKSILRITIKEICELAGISRVTFYAHYTDQFDLLQQIQNKILADLGELFEKHKNDGYYKDDIQMMIEEVLHYIAENNNSMQILMSENGDINFMRKILNFTKNKKIRKEYYALKGLSSDKMKDYISVFSTNGALSLIQAWLKNNMDVPIHDMAKFMCKLTVG